MSRGITGKVELLEELLASFYMKLEQVTFFACAKNASQRIKHREPFIALA
jgi:hypothetical protein